MNDARTRPVIPRRPIARGVAGVMIFAGWGLAIRAEAWPAGESSQAGVRASGKDRATLVSELREANDVFARAVATLANDRDAGSALALDAAARYRAIASDGGIRNHALEMNSGNAALLGGDTARAVLAFRRAEKIAPDNAAVRQSLAAARERVGTKITPATPRSIAERAMDAALAWRGHVSHAVLTTIALAAYVGAWACAGVSIVRPRRGLRATGLAAGLVATALFGLLLADEWDRTRVDGAVVVQAGTVGLKGPARGVYEPTFTAPLAPGVECVILETRGAWCRVRLSGGGETWVPASSLERV